MREHPDAIRRTWFPAVLLSFLLLSVPLFSFDRFDAVGRTADLCAGLGPSGQSELYNTGKTGRFYFTGDRRNNYMPDTGLSLEIQAKIDGLDPNVGVETLYLLETPGLQPGNPAHLLIVYNVLRRLNSLQGIEYYSASRERMRTFFKTFYPVSGPDSQVPLGDPLVESIPENETLFAFQEDLTFGKNVSRLVYRTTDADIGLSITNMEKMRYALIPLIQEEGMQMHLIIIPMENHILFYGNCAVKTIDFLGLVKKKKESFSNRIEAMYSWFQGQFDTNILTQF